MKTEPTSSTTSTRYKRYDETFKHSALEHWMLSRLQRELHRMVQQRDILKKLWASSPNRAGTL